MRTALRRKASKQVEKRRLKALKGGLLSRLWDKKAGFEPENSPETVATVFVERGI